MLCKSLTDNFLLCARKKSPNQEMSICRLMFIHPLPNSFIIIFTKDHHCYHVVHQSCTWPVLLMHESVRHENISLPHLLCLLTYLERNISLLCSQCVFEHIAFVLCIRNALVCGGKGRELRNGPLCCYRFWIFLLWESEMTLLCRLENWGWYFYTKFPLYTHLYKSICK